MSGITLKQYYNTFNSTNDFIETVNNELHKILDENKQFVYPDKFGRACNYHCGPYSNESKVDGCLFGRAFKNLGVNVSRWVGSIDYIIKNNLSIQCPKRWVIYQQLQDNGMFYGNIRDFYQAHFNENNHDE